MRPQLYGLVLVGGKSERMGHDKALLSFDGKHTQLERAVSLLSKVTDHAFVSLRKEQEFPLPDGANAVFDNFEEIKGPPLRHPVCNESVSAGGLARRGLRPTES